MGAAAGRRGRTAARHARAGDRARRPGCRPLAAEHPRRRWQRARVRRLRRRGPGDAGRPGRRPAGTFAPCARLRHAHAAGAGHALLDADAGLSAGGAAGAAAPRPAVERRPQHAPPHRLAGTRIVQARSRVGRALDGAGQPSLVGRASRRRSATRRGQAAQGVRRSHRHPRRAGPCRGASAGATPRPARRWAVRTCGTPAWASAPAATGAWVTASSTRSSPASNSRWRPWRHGLRTGGASRPRPPGRCMPARWSRRWPAGSMRARMAAAGWCASRTWTRRAACLAPTPPSCDQLATCGLRARRAAAVAVRGARRCTRPRWTAWCARRQGLSLRLLAQGHRGRPGRARQAARARGRKLVYPGTCRAGLHGRAPRAWRLRVPDGRGALDRSPPRPAAAGRGCRGRRLRAAPRRRAVGLPARRGRR